MPHVEQSPFISPISELCIELGLSADQVLVKDVAELNLKVGAPLKIPPGTKGKTVFAVTPENDPLLRGRFINAGWKHHGTQAGDIFWRTFP